MNFISFSNELQKIAWFPFKKKLEKVVGDAAVKAVHNDLNNIVGKVGKSVLHAGAVGAGTLGTIMGAGIGSRSGNPENMGKNTAKGAVVGGALGTASPFAINAILKKLSKAKVAGMSDRDYMKDTNKPSVLKGLGNFAIKHRMPIGAGVGSLIGSRIGGKSADEHKGLGSLVGAGVGAASGAAIAYSLPAVINKLKSFRK